MNKKLCMFAGSMLVSFSAVSAERNFNFFMTGDPQYDNGAYARNAVSDRTLKSIGDQILADTNLNKGLMIAGDLTQNTRPNDEFEFYQDAIDFYEDYVYDGQGNHDEHEPDDSIQRTGCAVNATWCVNEDDLISYLRRSRSTPVDMSPDGAVYSWEWQGIHFIQLGTFAGNRSYEKGQFPDVNPYDSLNFMRSDLAKNVGATGKPVVLMMHYSLNDAKEGGAWRQSSVADFWDSLEGYNVVGVMSGHIHYGTGGGWNRTAYRPAGATKGPDSLPNIVVGAALNGIYFKAEVRNDEMILKRFHVDSDGNDNLLSTITLDIARQAPGFAELKNVKSGDCLNVTSSSPSNGTDLQTNDCNDTKGQKWQYDIDDGLIRNKANESSCLDNKGQRYRGGDVHMWGCASWSDNQKWTYESKKLATRANAGIVLDSYGTSDGSGVGQWTSHGGSNQQWVWGKRDLESGIATNVQSMIAGGHYALKIRATKDDCSLEWSGSESGGERNARFDCDNEGDVMTFVPSSAPVSNSNGTYTVQGRIYTRNFECGLEWDGDLDDGERNAKFDCAGRADPLSITTTGLTSGAVTLESNGCGLQWDGDLDNGDRNAKWNCAPAYDTMVLSLVQETSELRFFTRTEEAAISGHNNMSLTNVTPQECAAACMSDQNNSWCVSFDYIKTNNSCDLSDKQAADVGGLKTDYTPGLLDHYSLNAIARFAKTEEAAISGHNNESLSNVTPEQCAQACLDDSRSSWCVSFDYVKTINSCDLSDKRAADVGGLKTDYSPGVLDHYSLR